MYKIWGYKSNPSYYRVSLKYNSQGEEEMSPQELSYKVEALTIELNHHELYLWGMEGSEGSDSPALLTALTLNS